MTHPLPNDEFPRAREHFGALRSAAQALEGTR